MQQKYLPFFFLLLLISFSPITLSNATLNTSDVAIFEIIQSGPQVLITLDFDLSVAPARGETKSLVVLILFTLPSDNTNNHIGSMIFFRTNTGENLIFWMVGDPFSTVGLWQMGNENEHFQVDHYQLSLIFIESSDVNNPDLEIIAQAKMFEFGSFDQEDVDFPALLNEFRPNFEFIEVSGLEYTFTTTTTKTKGFPSFLIPLNIGILIFLGLKRRKNKIVQS